MFLLNEEVNRVSDKVEALSDKMDTRFAAQDAKIEERFAAQDAKIEDLRRGQTEISQQLAVLIASLGRTDAAAAARGDPAGQRRYSKASTVAAMATLSDSAPSAMGIRTRRSANSYSEASRPCDSDPSTTATGPAPAASTPES